MSSTSASAQIALAVKATLDGYHLPRISEKPTILTVKNFTIELCQMAALVKSDKTGGKFGHMHLILNKKEYRVATKNNTATVDPLAKPPNVHPDCQSLTKDQLTKYKVLQLEDETKQQITAYVTQEKTSKEIVRRMVASIKTNYSEDLNNKYTGYNSKTPKLLLTHISKNYCKTTVTDQLQADCKFAKP